MRVVNSKVVFRFTVWFSYLHFPLTVGIYVVKRILCHYSHLISSLNMDVSLQTSKNSHMYFCYKSSQDTEELFGSLNFAGAA